MSRSKLFATVLIGLYSAVCSADITLPGQVKVWQPAAFSVNVLRCNVADSIAKSSDYGQKPVPNKKVIWIVYSDRDNNHVYESPSKTARQFDASKDLKMGDRVRIADISNGYALVYNEPREATTYPEISEFATSIGWVPMNHLILWRTCPADEYGIYRKALLAMNADEYQKSKSNFIGKSYTNPQDKSGSRNITTDMNFYFIMKSDKESGLVLLADAYNLDKMETHLFGWIDKSSMIAWNQRTCIEPNWDDEDVAALKNDPAYVYGTSDMTSASTLTKWNYGRYTETGKATKYRMNGKVLRYPILDNDASARNSSYKCTYFGTVGSNAALDKIAEDEARAREMRDKQVAKMKVLNIIVVIDGTKSMENYYQPVQQALVSACEGLGGAYTPRVGLVIFRDYADGKDDPENGLVEYVPMSDPHSSELTRYFKEGGAYHVKSSSKDHTFDEALYNGIWTALDMEEMGYSKENSNLLVVIGDCGNDPSYEQEYGPTQSQIVEKCVENNVHMLVFQVHKSTVSGGSGDALAESNYRFTDQMNEILMQSMNNKYKRLSAKAKVEWVATTGGFDLLPAKSLNAESFYLGSTRFPNNDEGIQVIEASELKTMLAANVLKFSQLIERIIADVPSDGSGFEGTSQSQAQNVGEEMRASFIESVLGSELTAMLAKSRSLVAITGYTPKSSNGIDYWKPVIFISTPEFDNLISRLQTVLASSEKGGSNIGEVRKNYVNAMLDIVRSMLPGMTEEQMMAMTQEEIVALIAGLNVSTRQLSGRPLREISDSKLCPDREFNAIIAAYKSKVNKLKNDKGNKKAYIYDFRGDNSYWIPIDDLP